MLRYYIYETPQKGQRVHGCVCVFMFCTEHQDTVLQECVCLCIDLVLSLSLCVCAGTPFADAREALRVSQEQATAADSQRSC